MRSPRAADGHLCQLCLAVYMTQLSVRIFPALNTAFSDWGNILYNTTIATAIADRLVENSEIFLLGGESLRKGNKTSDPQAAD